MTRPTAPVLAPVPLGPGGSVVLRGALDVERTANGLLPHRLPARARAQFPDAFVALMEEQPSGVRLAFRTEASTVELDVLPTKTVYKGAPPGPDGVYELLVAGHPAWRTSVPGGDVLTLDMATGVISTARGRPGTARFSGLPRGDKDVEIWLPQAERTELIALRADAPARPPTPTGLPLWVHHGSSISHGAEAEGPTGTWPAVAAARAGAELVNLGLGGNALLDPFTARALRDTEADLISLKIGINIVNTDAMRLRAFGPAVHGFLDTVREGHPGVPLLVVSPVLSPFVEERPGPTAPDSEAPEPRFRAFGDPEDVASGRPTLRVIRAELERITALRSAEDPDLHYLDGRALGGVFDVASSGRQAGGRGIWCVRSQGGGRRAPGVPPSPQGLGEGTSRPQGLGEGCADDRQRRERACQAPRPRRDVEDTPYGERDFARLPLPDGLHPGAEGHRLIGERFARLAFGDGGPFGPSGPLAPGRDAPDAESSGEAQP
ncbi:SGNH/GDSL hydrolase family protein [Streptomyces daliensis]